MRHDPLLGLRDVDESMWRREKLSGNTKRCWRGARSKLEEEWKRDEKGRVEINIEVSLTAGRGFIRRYDGL